jgi:hypothetical protein
MSASSCCCGWLWYIVDYYCSILICQQDKTLAIGWLVGSRFDHMVVGFTTTCAISAYHHWSCEFEFCLLRGVLDTTLCDKVCHQGNITCSPVDKCYVPCLSGYVSVFAFRNYNLDQKLKTQIWSLWKQNSSIIANFDSYNSTHFIHCTSHAFYKKCILQET